MDFNEAWRRDERKDRRYRRIVAFSMADGEHVFKSANDAGIAIVGRPQAAQGRVH